MCFASGVELGGECLRWTGRGEERWGVTAYFVPVQLSPSLEAPIRLELRKGAAVVTVDWPVSSAAACGAWLREWLG